MSKTLDSSLSTQQLELVSTTEQESLLQQNQKPGSPGRRFTKEDKCIFCGEPVRYQQTAKGVDYYAADCCKCNSYHKKYKLNSVEVGWLYYLQEGICANPGCNEKAGNVDHCHKTNKVRAVLCIHCNTALGQLGEDPQRIAGLIQYIAIHSEAP